MSAGSRFDLTPSSRKGGAQRIFASTVLLCEAFVSFFATLLAFGINYLPRPWVWAIGLGLTVLFVVASGLLRKSVGYYLGSVLQIGLLATGFGLSAMWFVAALFTILWIVAVVTGRRADIEKDRVDARYYAEHGRPEEEPTAPDDPPERRGRRRKKGEKGAEPVA